MPGFCLSKMNKCALEYLLGAGVNFLQLCCICSHIFLLCFCALQPSKAAVPNCSMNQKIK